MPRYPGIEAVPPDARRLAVIGDTQETALMERLVGLEDNSGRRPRLLAELAARRPEVILHLGDMVAFGSSPAHWARLDALLGAVAEAGVPILPAIGNHDRMLLAPLGLTQVRQRFGLPAERTWYRFRTSGVELVVLDTNLVDMRSRRAQSEWLEETLAAADGDDDVRAIVAYWHHPPLTNSRLVRPSRLARKVFVPLLAKSDKAVAVFSGHCHAYERFQIDGLHCFVSGGGGGPRHTLEQDPARRRGEDLFAGERLRFMHFLEVELAPDRLTVRAIRMRDDDFVVAETVVVPYRGAPAWRLASGAVAGA